MEKGNVLVIGNSGVGKSTLINAVLGEEVAKTGWGISGTTPKLEIYETEDNTIPFRVIDSIGFEPAFLKRKKAIDAVKQWSKDCAKKGMEDNKVNVIWFCVDGTARKLFPQTIENMVKATSIWKSVPVIAVITKSYSIPEREENIEMVRKAFDAQKNSGINLKTIIPVVASTYVLNDSAYAPPEGITELINVTNELMPDGFKQAEKDLSQFILTRKRVLSHSIVAAATTTAAVIGAVPIPFSDALILGPTEIAEVNAIAQIYGIGKNDDAKKFLNSIVEVGTVSVAAKAAIDALKAIPGINLAASVINAVIAGVIVAGLGEGSIYAFEQVYLGNKTVADIDWVKKIIESKLALNIAEKAKIVFDQLDDKSDKKDIIKAVLSLIPTLFKEDNKVINK